MLISYQASAQNLKGNLISWSRSVALPAVLGEKQLGVAGPFVGLSNGVLLIAGGSNFPGAKPWDGGKKVNKKDIYVLTRLPTGKYTWLSPENPYLPQELAYGASVSTSKGVVCIGGETDQASCSNLAFIMQWNAAANRVDFHLLPPLLVPVVNACAASIGNKVYVFGGESNRQAINWVFELNLQDDYPAWKNLPPMPVALSHSVAVVQSNGMHNCIYIIGGRSATPSGISNLHKSTFCFDPVKGKWSRLSDIGDGIHKTNISAASAVAVGTNEIILIGGDKGDIFHQIESYNALIEEIKDERKKQETVAKKLALVTHHPGFSRDVYRYNTKTDKWKKIGELPFYGQVTTTAVKWDNDILIPCGEIMPGTRTPNVTIGKMTNE